MHAVGSGIVTRLRTFWPMLAGIICARTALIVACYGSYSSTDNGIFTDGAMLVVCGMFLVCLVALWRTKRFLPENAVQVIFAVSVAVAAGCSIALSLVDSTDESLRTEGFVLSVVSTLALSLCMFYWLRSLRGTDEVTAALFVFGAFIVSVFVVYLLSFAPTRAQNIVGAVLIVAQLVLVGPASTHQKDLAGRPHRRARTFFTFARSHMQDVRFLVACTVGMGALSFVDGFLRGYPDGLPIAFTPQTRAAYALLTIAVCVFLMVLVVRRRERVMTVAIFVVMELLASASLVLFGAFPFHWEIGAVTVNTLNIVICAYCWYVIVAFTSFGDRDPYLYAMGGWIVCFGMRAVARMLLLFVYPLTGNDLLINSVLGALILVSAQVVLVQFLLAEHGEWSQEIDRIDERNAEALAQAARDVAEREEQLAVAKRELESSERAVAVEAAIRREAFEALSEAQSQRCVKCSEVCPGTGGSLTSDVAQIVSAPAPVRASTPSAPSAPAATPTSVPATGSTLAQLTDSMRASVRRMGEHFLLSDREVDVLTLYALGHTQKKLAEELYITPATAHTHIKRIYAKCGMHSRQEILEYLESYDG